MRLGRQSKLTLFAASSANHHNFVYADHASQARGCFARQLPGLRCVNELATLRVRPATPEEHQIIGLKRVPFAVTAIFPDARKNPIFQPSLTVPPENPADAAANEILIRARIAVLDRSIHDLAASDSVHEGATAVIYFETVDVLTFSTREMPARRRSILAFTAGRYDPQFLLRLK